MLRLKSIFIAVLTAYLVCVAGMHHEMTKFCLAAERWPAVYYQ